MNAEAAREGERTVEEPIYSKVSPDQRAAHIPIGYSAAAHVTRTVLMTLLIGGFAIALARKAALVDWLAVPVFFVVANFIEWMVHKGPMHRPVPPRFMYVNHTLIHHRSFDQSSMPITSPRELNLIMMPWFTMLGLFVLASPVALVAALLRGPGMVGIFYVCAASYFLMYETLHASYHLPERLLARLHLSGNPVYERLRSHHRHHHVLGRMAKVNFNVTFPLMDWLLGTREPEGGGTARRRTES